MKKLPDDVKDGKDKDKFNKDKKLKEQKETIQTTIFKIQPYLYVPYNMDHI